MTDYKLDAKPLVTTATGGSLGKRKPPRATDLTAIAIIVACVAVYVVSILALVWRYALG